MDNKDKLYDKLDEAIKPTKEENLQCDGCQNAIRFALTGEVRFYCKVMHTITWTSKDRTAIQVCSDLLPALAPVQSQPTALEQQEHDPSDIPNFDDFEPDTTPFVNKND